MGGVLKLLESNSTYYLIPLLNTVSVNSIGNANNSILYMNSMEGKILKNKFSNLYSHGLLFN